MALTRIVYTGSSVIINASWVSTPPLYVPTVQNATVTVNVPRENVNVFGVTGTVDRPQLNAADATLEFSMIPEISASASTLQNIDLNAMMADAKANAPTRITSIEAVGIGRITDAIMNSLSIDAAVGALPTMNLGFTGNSDGMGTAVVVSVGSGTGIYSTISLVEPRNISLLANMLPNGSCAQSAAVAWDMPVELVTCLGHDPRRFVGGVPNTAYTAPTTFGNPPGTASFTIESLGNEVAESVAATTYVLNIGSYAFTLSGARIDSKTNSLAVGDLFGTFNYVLGGTADGMTVG